MSTSVSSLYYAIFIVVLTFNVIFHSNHSYAQEVDNGHLVISDDFEKINLNEKAISEKVLSCQNNVNAVHHISLPSALKSRLSVESTNVSSGRHYTRCLLSFSVTAAFTQKTKDTLVLSIINPIVRHVDAFIMDSEGHIITHKKLGLKDSRPNEPGYKSHQSIRFDVSRNETYEVVVYIRSLSNPAMLIDLYALEHFENYHQVELIFWGASIALLLGGALYNSFIYLISRSRSYVWYLIFYVVAFVYFSAFHGFGQLIWPPAMQVWLGSHILLLSFILLWLLIQFSMSFLMANEHAPRLSRYRIVLDILIVLFIVASFSAYTNEVMLGLLLLELAAGAFCVNIASSAWKKGFHPARFFVLSWSCLLIGALIALCARIGILPLNLLTYHAFFIGVLLELTLLSVALADRLKYAENLSFKYAFTDPRTLQPNLPYFSSRYFQVSNEQEKPCCLLLIQLEGVEQLSSHLGPQKTKLLYREIVKRIETELAKASFVATYDVGQKKSSYMITLPDDVLLIMTHQANATQTLAQKLIGIAETSVELDGIMIRINSRAGIAAISFDEMPRNNKQQTVQAIYEAYRKALVALNSDKSQPINLYQQDQDLRIGEQVALLTDLQDAIEKESFTLFIQPQFTTNNNSLVGGEVLIRWQHSERGFVSPAEFIPLAEQTGNIYPITKIVIKKAFAWFHSNIAALDGFSMAINLSVHDVNRESLFPYLETLLNRYSLAPNAITFEITESAMSEDHDRFLHSVRRLKAMGFKIALDDFGTGYSSMRYLQQIEADEIKIDMSFVRNIHQTPINKTIVASITNIAHATGALTLAEGIESEAERETLLQLNVNRVQGFFLGKPTCADEFLNAFPR